MPGASPGHPGPEGFPEPAVPASLPALMRLGIRDGPGRDEAGGFSHEQPGRKPPEPEPAGQRIRGPLFFPEQDLHVPSFLPVPAYPPVGGIKYKEIANVTYTPNTSTPMNQAERPLFATNAAATEAKNIMITAPGQNSNVIGAGPRK